MFSCLTIGGGSGGETPCDVAGKVIGAGAWCVYVSVWIYVYACVYVCAWFLSLFDFYIIVTSKVIHFGRSGDLNPGQIKSMT